MKHVSILVSFLLLIFCSCEPNHKKPVDILSNINEQHFLDSLNVIWDTLTVDSLNKICADLKLNKLKVLCYQKALKGFESNGDSSEILQTLNNLVTVNYYLPDYGSSDYYAGLAYSKAYEYGIDTISWLFADAVYHMAMINERKNLFNKSEAFYNRAFVIEDSLKYSSNVTYNGFGHLCRKRGDLERAKQSFLKAIEKSEDSDISLIPFYYNIGHLHQQLKNYKVAKSFYRKSLQKVELAKNNETKWFQQNVFYNNTRQAEIALEMQQLDSVRYYLKTAEPIKEKFNSKLSDHYLFNLLSGKLASIEGNDSLVLQCFDKAEGELQEEYKSIGRDPVVSIIYKEKALYLLEKKKYQEALINIQKALHQVCNTFDAIDDHQVPKPADIYSKHKAIELLGVKARILKAFFQESKEKKHQLEALKTYQFIHTLIPKARQDVSEEASKYNLAKEASSIYKQAIELSILLFKETEQKKYLEATLQFIEGNKTTTLMEDLKSNEAVDNGTISFEKRQALTALKAEINFFERESYRTNNEQKNYLTDRLFQLKQEYQQQLTSLEKQYPEYYALKYNHQPISIKQLQQTLDKDEVLLEYYLTDQQIYQLQITPTESTIITIDKRPQFDADLRHLLSIIAERPKNSADIAFYYRLAHRLYKDLLGTVNLKTTNKLTIIPDGDLSQLPFGTLLIEQAKPGGRTPFSKEHLNYLIEQTAIGYHYSARLLVETEKSKQEMANKLFLGIAPDSQLASSEQEVEQIKAELKSGDLMLQKSASKAALLGTANQYRILHFAAHAKQDTRNPKFNEIELFANDRLTSSDIESMRLNADLTVLSACETGVGKLQTGEGVLSLARSFFIAGSPSLVASLWKVDDVSTSALLLQFYGGLTQGQNKSEAIRHSKLEYLEKNKQNQGRSHPFFWSGLVVIGNDGMLKF